MTAPHGEPGTAISPHEVAVYRTIVEAGTWLTNIDIAGRLAGNIPPVKHPTVRKATARLHEVGLLRRQFVHPSFKYRTETEPLIPRAQEYRERLHQAAEALGRPIDTRNEAAK